MINDQFNQLLKTEVDGCGIEFLYEPAVAGLMKVGACERLKLVGTSANLVVVFTIPLLLMSSGLPVLILAAIEALAIMVIGHCFVNILKIDRVSSVAPEQIRYVKIATIINDHEVADKADFELAKDQYLNRKVGKQWYLAVPKKI